MAECCKAHLSEADCIFVATTMLENPERFTLMLNAYGGMSFESREGAALVLRLAKRIHAERGAVS